MSTPCLFGHDWNNGLSCRLCPVTRTPSEAIISGLASRRGGNEQSAQTLLDALRADDAAEISRLRAYAGNRQAREEELLAAMGRTDLRETPEVWALGMTVLSHLDAPFSSSTPEELEPGLLALIGQLQARIAELEDERQSTSMPSATDTLPAWLHWRFGRSDQRWNTIPDEDRSYWEHHSQAVRRAVARGGFKPGGDDMTLALDEGQSTEAATRR